MIYKVLWQAWLLSPAILGAIFVASTRVLAVETPTIQLQPVVNTAMTPTQDKLEPLAATVVSDQAKTSEVTLPSQEGSATLSNTVNKISQLGNNLNSPESDVLKQINSDSNDSNNSLDQVTNVTQLSDVSPSDWAYPSSVTFRNKQVVNKLNHPEA